MTVTTRAILYGAAPASNHQWDYGIDGCKYSARNINILLEDIVTQGRPYTHAFLKKNKLLKTHPVGTGMAKMGHTFLSGAKI